MRRVLSFALLFAYVSAVLSALSPLVYYFANQDYIAQNLCENDTPINQECQGMCYLNNQLSEAAEKENHEMTVELEKFPELLNKRSFCVKSQSYHTTESFSNLSNLYVSEWIHDVFHPPTFVSNT
ncbi:MAG: hypothetical protein P8I82_03030 [Flavobacteriales bacterium]|nr:hypothetical protein [Flavobacteriales bacterium]